MLLSKPLITPARWTLGVAAALALGVWAGACAGRQAAPPSAPAPASASAPASAPGLAQPAATSSASAPPLSPPASGAAPAAANLPGARPMASPQAEASTAEAAAHGPHELLNAVVWMQTSAEYRAAMLAAYGRATRALDALLADRTATAALEQKGDFASLPPAVILDVDETILDNLRFEGEQIRRNASTFDSKLWDQWVQEARAVALPGAVEFLKAARQKGVRTFFVTNRDAPGESATVANLRQVGIDAIAEDVLLKGENGWVSDKTARRAHVAATYRILMLCGDDLGDFISVQGLDVGARAAAVDGHAAWWGERWVVLPNPAYGSWERAVVGSGDPVERKRRAVRAMTE